MISGCFHFQRNALCLPYSYRKIPEKNQLGDPKSTTGHLATATWTVYGGHRATKPTGSAWVIGDGEEHFTGYGIQPSVNNDRAAPRSRPSANDAISGESYVERMQFSFQIYGDRKCAQDGDFSTNCECSKKWHFPNIAERTKPNIPWLRTQNHSIQQQHFR